MPRHLAIFVPNGRTEYWLTQRTIDVGDVLNRGGQRQIVTSISTPTGFATTTKDGDYRHATVTLRAEGDATSD